MNSKNPIISKGILKKDQLNGLTVLVTGAGGGIGFETSRSLIWLGAKVIIAEVDKAKGKAAEMELRKEFGDNKAFFIHTDVGSERSIKKLRKYLEEKFGKLDVIFNNATIAPIGAVHMTGIEKWDKSYAVNLRGPVLLTSYFLPDMLKRNAGILVFVPSSGAAPYMGAYEVFKTAQVELCNTLAGEFEGTGLITFSIGPGIVKTETAQKAIAEIAPLYGKSTEEFFQMNKSVLISVEEAGAGFAASIALAAKYNGLEVSSIQALIDAGIEIGETATAESLHLSEEDKSSLLNILHSIHSTFIQQVDGWYKRIVFEKQWIIRDFKKYAGASPEYFIDEIKRIETAVTNNELTIVNYDSLPYEKLKAYYVHQIELLKGYEKSPDTLKENISIMDQWISEIDTFKTRFTQLLHN